MSRNDHTPDNLKKKAINTKSEKKPVINMSKLVNVRIIQKHLVYVIGLSSSISTEKVNC